MIKYLNQNQIAEILGIKSSTISHHRCVKKKGWDTLPYIKIGGVILYPEEEFFRWLESKTINNKEG